MQKHHLRIYGSNEGVGDHTATYGHDKAYAIFLTLRGFFFLKKMCLHTYSSVPTGILPKGFGDT